MALKQYTVRIPYEDNSGYFLFSFYAGKQEDIPYGTTTTAILNGQQFKAKLKQDYDINLDYDTARINAIREGLGTTAETFTEEFESVFNLAEAPVYDKNILLNNTKYRLHLTNATNGNASLQTFVNNDWGSVLSYSVQSTSYPGRAGSNTYILEFTNPDDLTTFTGYAATLSFNYRNDAGIKGWRFIAGSRAAATNNLLTFINNILGLEPIDLTDPYGPDPSLLPSDLIGDDIATGYMQYGDTNLFTIFVPTQVQIQDLAAKMYGTNLWTWLQGLSLSVTGVNDDIMNLYVLPTTVTATGTKYISGNRIPTGSSVSMNYTNTNYVIVDCGSVTIPKLYNNFLDYTSQIQIYLPFVGYQSLDTEDVMGKTIGVTYRIDLLTGDAAIAIKINGSVMYQFQGNTAYGLPGSADHYSDIISKGLTAATMIAVGKSAMNAGQTQLNQSEVLYGEGKLNAAEASKMASTGEKEIARGQAMRQKAVGDLANIKFGGSTRSGAMGGNTGLLSVIKPYLIIKRPKVEVPSNYSVYNGYPCNKYLNLGSISGYTEVEEIHIEGINATLGELEEIESLLKAGVTF